MIRIVVATICVIVFGFLKAMEADDQWGGRERPSIQTAAPRSSGVELPAESLDIAR